jgi:hypothetical protein
MASDFEKQVLEKLGDLHTEQVRQGVILETHEKRSTQLEARVAPIEAHVQKWAGVGKALAIAGTLLSLLAALVKLFG